MSRVQLALNVSDLEAGIDFYSKLFSTEPRKVRPGYANFAIADPPLKLILVESPDSHTPDGQSRLNHLGVEVETTDDVAATERRLTDQGLDAATEDNVECCYAIQDKVWVDDPDGAPWEIYTVLEDVDPTPEELRTAEAARGCSCGVDAG